MSSKLVITGPEQFKEKLEECADQFPEYEVEIDYSFEGQTVVNPSNSGETLLLEDGYFLTTIINDGEEPQTMLYEIVLPAPKP